MRLACRTIQKILGGLWLLDGLLQLQPFMLTRGFASSVLAPTAQGQLAVIAWPILEAARIVAVHPVAWDLLFAAIQIAIGVGLLTGRLVKPALVVSFVWACGVWWVGEGFGDLPTGATSMLAGAPGAVILYAVVGLLIWPRVGSTSAADSASDESRGVIGERAARIIWVVLWVGSALLRLLPSQLNATAISATLRSNVNGAPGLLAHADTFLAHAVRGHEIGIIVLLAIVEAAIGLGVALRVGTRAFLALSILLSVVFWVFGQSLGGLYSGQATDPDSGPLFILLALALWPARGRWHPEAGTDGYDRGGAEARSTENDARRRSGSFGHPSLS